MPSLSIISPLIGKLKYRPTEIKDLPCNLNVQGFRPPDRRKGPSIGIRYSLYLGLPYRLGRLVQMFEAKHKGTTLLSKISTSLTISFLLRPLLVHFLLLKRVEQPTQRTQFITAHLPIVSSRYSITLLKKSNLYSLSSYSSLWSILTKWLEEAVTKISNDQI